MAMFFIFFCPSDNPRVGKNCVGQQRHIAEPRLCYVVSPHSCQRITLPQSDMIQRASSLSLVTCTEMLDPYWLSQLHSEKVF
jgi:hypothetical protein